MRRLGASGVLLSQAGDSATCCSGWQFTGGADGSTAAVLQPTWVQAVVAAPLPDPALLTPSRGGRPDGRGDGRGLLRISLRLLPLEWLIPLILRTPLLRTGLQGAYFMSIAEDQELLALIGRPARRPTAAGPCVGCALGMAIRPQAITAPALLHTLQRPLLLIWGRQDRFVPLSIAESIRKEHPGVALEVLEECGHCPYDEVPDRFIDVLMPWLDRNLGDIRPAGTGSGDETHPFGGCGRRIRALSRIAGLVRAARLQHRQPGSRPSGGGGAITPDHGCGGG